MRSQLTCASAIILTLGLAGTASAAPITFLFDTGTAAVQAFRTIDFGLVVDTTIDLDGVSVTFDPTVPELIDFEITAPQSDPISLLLPYGGYDTFVIESASIEPGALFTESVAGGPTNFTFTTSNIDIDGFYSASHTSGLPLPVTNQSVPFSDTETLDGTIDTDAMTFELIGITLAVLPGSAFGESPGNDLIVKADITWSGGIAVPEPSSATLFLLGGGWLGFLSHRARRSTRAA